MSSIESDILAALFTRVASLSLPGTPPVAWPNVPFTPPALAPYIRVEVIPNANTRRALKGSNAHIRQGILQLTVVFPLPGDVVPGGIADPTELAGLIAEHFPADLQMWSGGRKVRVQAAPDVMMSDPTDVSWDVPVSIRYECLA